MNIYWIFTTALLLCIYIFFGLHVSEGLDSSTHKILIWVVYTILWITVLNIFTIGYFWSIIIKKTGPSGIRGPIGNMGSIGVPGECNLDDSKFVCMKSLNDYINNLYKQNTNVDILNVDTQTFPCHHLNEKIQTLAGSRQYNIVISDLSNDNKGIDNLINYLKSIWKLWFDLIYDATSVPGIWFTDEFGDENGGSEFEWVGNNPFDEIKKYDIYYWGITRDFRPLKAELCRSNIKHGDSKFPKHHLSQDKDTQVHRLKIIETNDYYKMGDTDNNDDNQDGSWWSPRIQNIEGDTYYPVGDIMLIGNNNPGKYGSTIVGDNQYGGGGNGPDKKTILVTGDVVDPAYYIQSADPHTKSRSPSILTPICPNGYTSIGDIAGPGGRPGNAYKCLPSDCLEQVAPGPIHQENESDPNQWNRYNKWFGSNLRYHWTWYSSINVLDRNNNEPTYYNGYNLMRGSESQGSQGYPYYRIKRSCLEKVPNRAFPPLPQIPPPSIKDVDSDSADLGIGWYGHPYKLDPKYSIFSFLNLVPEGMIVNQGTGQRFYIVHVEGQTINLFNILTYNNNSNKFDGSLQLNLNKIDDPNDKNVPNNKNYKNNSNINVNLYNPNDTYVSPVNFYPPSKRIIIVQLDKTNINQQWKIMLDENKKLFKMKNMYDNTYLLITQESREGLVEFTSIDIDNDNYLNDPALNTMPKDEIDNRTKFSFISTFGTQLDIIDKDDQNIMNN